MNDDPTNELDLIERYLVDKLGASKKKEVEIKILNDPKFAGKVEGLKQIKQLLHTAGVEQRAKAELREIYLERRTLKRGRTRSLWLSLAISAACISFVLYFALAPVKLPTIDDDLLTVRGEAAQKNDVSGQSTAYGQLLEGQNAIENKNYLLAINYLEKVQREQDLRSYFREATQWYLALAYLNSNQPRAAEHYFNKLRELDNPEYQVDWVERWKLYVQIQRRKFF
ncbi:hypothetical protein [Dyadobacter diqingensis]|uniref:hypothetical protein n=1 Tax=Dyadobacter diqingensis TaxID=2938121 RepID=UPI0020C19C55|nr:hypothetical protein [Dyadobacter diqingensis]